MLHIFADRFLNSFKSDGKSAKNVKLVGKGFLHLVDHYFCLFWYLPFASVKQGHAMRQKSGAPSPKTIETRRWQTIVAEHEVDGAREQLIAGWKQWLAEREAAGAVNAVAPIQIEQD